MILGIDEVGRGPWAGPLVIGAVILGGAKIDGLDDSKKLTKKRREALSEEIRENAAAWALGWVSARELDEIGMSEALRLACRRAVEQIQAICRTKNLKFSEIIIDGKVNFLAGTALEKYTTTLAKADGLIPSVSAASIVAKVARDNFMAEQDAIYPGYGFAANAGYGVAKHRAAIEKLGVTPLHRLSFAPLAKYRDFARDPQISPEGVDSRISPGENLAPDGKFSAENATKNAAAEDSQKASRATTRQIGDVAENLVAASLERRGHEIIARNWRTRWCEIDIVSAHGENLFFTEVKYRKNAAHGDGLAAITPKKLEQMRFAAEFFIAKNPQFAKFQPQMVAASVAGEPPAMQEIVIIE